MRCESSYASPTRRGFSTCVATVMVIFSMLIGALGFALYAASTTSQHGIESPSVSAFQSN